MKMSAKQGALFFLVFIINAGCVKEEPTHEIFCGDPLFPYFCPSSGKCCSLPFYGKNLNKCYSTLSECASSGQSCEACAIEENNKEAKNNFYANWDCDGTDQCEQLLGASAGTAGPFCDEAACKAWGDKFISGGYTCDNIPTFTPTTGSPPDGNCFKVGDF
jgi:hypothetical protein